MRELDEVCEQSFDLAVFIEKQANNLCEYISDMQTVEDKNIKEKRKKAAYNWSVLVSNKV